MENDSALNTEISNVSNVFYFGLLLIDGARKRFNVQYLTINDPG